ncbi:unnamed protein product [Caenorhabditis bovis]|uniref:Kynurenine 3-monooxygenase n=1 Tax=Caenorhabditis bovis TaxID=2654633 RepID=A0A8S1E9R8_9PELO|nr:unnamed protein product [Caenorhabditis bovis]
MRSRIRYAHLHDINNEPSFRVYEMIVLFFAIFGICFLIGFNVDIPQTVQTVSMSAKETIYKVFNIQSVNHYAEIYFNKAASEFLNCSAFFNNSKDSIDVYVNRGRLRIYPDDPKDLAMDCDSMHSRIHGDISNFSQLKRSVAFVRNIYNSYELQEIFISTNYHPNQTFCHVLDKKSSEDFKRKMRKLDDCFDNILVLDKELDFDSKGHDQDRGHFLCLEAILNRNWNHALLLQNYDLVVKSNEELSEISEILNISSAVELEDPNPGRFDKWADWTGLKLFKNETGIPDEILHTKLFIRKSLNEPIMQLFNSKWYYGVDEMLVHTLYANKLGLKGQMIANCTKSKREFTRFTDWNVFGGNGFDRKCKSKWKRHGICIMGIEYLDFLANSNSLTANKVMADVDMGTPICMHEFLLGKLDRKPTFNHEFVRQYPQVRELAQIANRTFNPANFKSLNACFFAQKGWDVEVYEYRKDIRTMKHVQGRSINLALSQRGKSALEAVGLKEYIVSQGVPMYSRLVHNKDGKTFSRQPYGQPGEHIVSINRRHLNEVMITQAEKCPNVKFFFEHKVKGIDYEKKELIVQNPEPSEFLVHADLIIACDGAYSAVRRSLMTIPRFNFSQEYIEHGYVELNIMANNNNDFALEANVFHLWPRGHFTLIALANKDKTFTVTIFAPFSEFEKHMSNTNDVLKFFEENFPDAYQLLGKDHIVDTFNRVKPQPLVSIKCAPHHFFDNLLLMGDAAHAMVPFYGQGMNCGFEDCLVFSEILEKCGDRIPDAIETYTKCRVKDAHTINDLAMYNYEELKDLVNHSSYKLRKKFDLFMNKLFPNSWIPLYSMVTFTRTPYSEVVEKRKRQDRILSCVFNSLSCAALAAMAVAVYKNRANF